ncbi:hypothetical protein AMAG_17190 [Allomyces macrogynus ATCC 38327]|uniref:Uncharacterized protein n=1 Tax=Allomyces macrogynus (strain ATCC 38327) TaxID=578462 RepID=A0A0L0TE80_ALLM3|nr:hypothetical protein AMAG_17190 [Allomyces macrogynus ATCC 38327]|eukprot:KNE72961.1 hypothetical protein AMAG_17190 [Allomyces macrogynus ATCC 38327]
MEEGEESSGDASAGATEISAASSGANLVVKLPPKKRRKTADTATAHGNGAPSTVPGPVVALNGTVGEQATVSVTVAEPAISPPSLTTAPVDAPAASDDGALRDIATLSAVMAAASGTQRDLFVTGGLAQPHSPAIPGPTATTTSTPLFPLPPAAVTTTAHDADMAELFAMLNNQETLPLAPSGATDTPPVSQPTAEAIPEPWVAPDDAAIEPLIASQTSLPVVPDPIPAAISPTTAAAAPPPAAEVLTREDIDAMLRHVDQMILEFEGSDSSAPTPAPTVTAPVAAGARPVAPATAALNAPVVPPPPPPAPAKKRRTPRPRKPKTDMTAATAAAAAAEGTPEPSPAAAVPAPAKPVTPKRTSKKRASATATAATDLPSIDPVSAPPSAKKPRVRVPRKKKTATPTPAAATETAGSPLSPLPPPSQPSILPPPARPDDALRSFPPTLAMTRASDSAVALADPGDSMVLLGEAMVPVDDSVTVPVDTDAGPDTGDYWAETAAQERLALALARRLGLIGGPPPPQEAAPVALPSQNEPMGLGMRLAPPAAAAAAVEMPKSASTALAAALSSPGAPAWTLLESPPEGTAGSASAASSARSPPNRRPASSGAV